MQAAFSRFNLITLLFFCPFLTPIAPAALAQQEAQVQLQISNNTVEVGQEFRLSVLVSQKGNSEVITLRQAMVKGVDGFREGSSSTSNQISIVNGQATAVARLEKVLIPDSAGDFTIGPAEVVTAEGETLTSNTLKLTVVPQPEVVQIDGQEEPVPDDESAGEVPERQSESPPEGMFLPAFLLMVILLLIAGLFAFVRSYRSGEREIASSGQEERAEPAIDLARIEVPDGRTSPEEFFRQISRTVREYLKLKEKFDATSMTTAEIVERLRQRQSPRTQAVEEILHDCDRFHFAREEVSRAEVIQKTKNLLSSFSSL